MLFAFPTRFKLSALYLEDCKLLGCILNLVGNANNIARMNPQQNLRLKSEHQKNPGSRDLARFEERLLYEKQGTFKEPKSGSIINPKGYLTAD